MPQKGSTTSDKDYKKRSLSRKQAIAVVVVHYVEKRYAPHHSVNVCCSRYPAGGMLVNRWYVENSVKKYNSIYQMSTQWTDVCWSGW